MAYKLYLDKHNLFECDIQLQGASIKNSFARIIVEGKEHSYIFNGEIDENGHCSVPMNKLKGIFETNETGTMKLEVVADDVYFSPWTDSYKIDLSKKIDVVIKEQEEPVKPMISVSVKQQPLVKESEKVIKKVKPEIKNTVTPPKKVTKNTSESTIKISDIKKILNSK